jgi:hypothetical protein
VRPRSSISPESSRAGSTSAWSRIAGTSDNTSSIRCIEAVPRCTSVNTQPMMKIGKVSSMMYIEKAKNSA